MEQKITGDQYIAQLKQGVYVATGALSTQVSNAIDQITQQWLACQKTTEFLQTENQRLKGILTTNKISFNKELPKSKIEPIAVQK